MRRPCFAEGEIGLASLTEPTTTSTNRAAPFFSRSTKRSPTYRTLSTSGSSNFSPRWCSSKLYDPRCEEPHFLESCFLCKKPLGDNRDIFMYRGDTPFCSEECRQEQIEMDEANEKKRNLSASMKAIRKETTKSTPNKSQNYQPRTSPVVAS